MRKLLILTSAIAMVCSAQAASYLWGLAGGEIITPTGSYDDGDYLEGGTAFLFLGTVTASANAFDMSSATYIASSQMDDTTYTYGSMDESSLASSSDVASTAAGQAFSIILIEKDDATLADLTDFDGDYVLYTGTSTEGKIADSGGGDTVFYAKFFDQGSTYEGAWSSMTPASPEPPDPVPEPTSGLLVLLGMAGLALKRKHA